MGQRLFAESALWLNRMQLPCPDSPVVSIGITLNQGGSTVEDRFFILDGPELLEMEGAFSLIILEDDVISGRRTSAIGELNPTEIHYDSEVLQAVRRGANSGDEGLYATSIIDFVRVKHGQGTYLSAVVSPDRTIPGDSGSPLIVDGAVVAVYNSSRYPPDGTGRYGAINNESHVNKLAAFFTYLLRENP